MALAPAPAQAQSPEDGPKVLRHALVVGANQGGGLEPLRYAERDAARMQEVLAELGGFAAHQITVLQSPDRDQIEGALRAHHAMAAAADQDLFLFYYSGHADARGLRLGDELIPYAELRSTVRAMPSEVTLGVLDACRSGEITRLKGFTLSTPFAEDSQLSAEGEAWLTAASADEAAQESDRLGGSFFTHYLVSGLRGAADSGGDEAGDGKVSLDEAYRYAYDRTVARTGLSDNGTQHPGYDFRLQGRGNLPITDVSHAKAALILPEEISGEVTVLRLPEETPMAEVAKPPNQTVTVALPPGRYLLRLRGHSGVGESIIGLSEGATLKVRDFRQVQVEVAAAKGAPADPAAIITVDSPEASPGAPPEAPATIAIEDVMRDENPEVDALESDTLWPGPESERGPREGSLQKAARNMRTWWTNTRTRIEQAADDGRQALEEFQRPAPAPIKAEELNELAARPCVEVGPKCLDRMVTEGGLPQGQVQLLHESEKVAAVGTLVDGRAQGEWVFYMTDGSPYARGTYDSGQRSGPWLWWYPDGRKLKRGVYAGGNPTGAWTEWYANGKRRKKTEFVGGEPFGMSREWYDNGTKKSEGAVYGDQKQGRWSYWYENGTRRAAGQFHAGQRTGNWTTWFANGRKASHGHYTRDLRDGTWDYWWEGGAPSARGKYAAGEKHGNWMEFHPDGARKGKGAYMHGQAMGKWVRWDTAGNKTVHEEAADGESAGR